MAINNIIKVSRAIIENCPAPCYFIQYLGYVIKWYRRLKLKDRSNHIAMTFNMAYSAIRIEKNKAIIQSAIVMAFLYPNSSLFLYVQIMLSNFFFMLGMPFRMLKTTNPNTRRNDMPYTIDCATSRLVQPCKSSIKPFRELPVPLHIDIKPSQREIKK